MSRHVLETVRPRRGLVLLDKDVRSHITCEVYEDTEHSCFYCVSIGRVDAIETSREVALDWLAQIRAVDDIVDR